MLNVTPQRRYTPTIYYIELEVNTLTGTYYDISEPQLFRKSYFYFKMDGRYVLNNFSDVVMNIPF
jgi:hypothetical protein